MDSATHETWVGRFSFLWVPDTLFNAMKSLVRPTAVTTPLTIQSWETRWFECKVRRQLDELPGAVVLLDQGMIVEMNTRAPAILGRPAEQILCHSLKEFARSDDAPRLTRWLESELLSPLLVIAVGIGKGQVGIWLQQHGHFTYQGRRVCMTSLIPENVRPESVQKSTAYC
jgi:PAS domain-containing protein